MEHESDRFPRYLVGWLVLLTCGVIWLLARQYQAPPTTTPVPQPWGTGTPESRSTPPSSPGPPVSGRTTAPLAALEQAFVEISSTVSPAVVYIHSEWPEGKSPRRQDWPDLEEWFQRRFGEGMPFLPPPSRQPPSEAAGSGMIFRPDGYILTNAHVVENARRVQVKMEPEGQFIPAKILGWDLRTDLAVLKVDVEKELPMVVFGDSDRVRIGSWVLAIGSPFEFESSVTLGIVSARGRELPDPRFRNFSHRDLIQTDASINPGNSGGPLVNIRGEVIGVNVAIFSPSGGNVGIGFAVPINAAHKILDELIERGEVRRGYLGVGVKGQEPEALEALYGVREGALVASVEPGAPAAQAGLQAEDVITEFNGQKVAHPNDLIDAVTATEPGQKVPLKLVRDKKLLTVQVKVAELPVEFGGTAGSSPRRQAADQDVLGLSVENLPRSLPSGMEVPEGGVFVRKVQPASPASDAGFLPHMVITQIRDRKGNHPIRSLGDYQRVIRNAKKGDYLAFTVLRPGLEGMISDILDLKIP